MRIPEFQYNEHFQHLLKLDTLCKNGYIQEAQTIANKDIPIEQALLSSYCKKMPTQKTSDLLHQNSLSVSKNSELSTFPINPYTVDILNAYGKNIKEITEFQSNSLRQLINHNFIVDSINAQAQRIYTSKNITEQALAIHTIDGLLKAYDLNKKGIIENIPQYLENYRKIARNLTTEFAINFLKRLSNNFQHPVQYIKEQVAGTMHLAHFIVDLSIGQLFRTPSEAKQYFIELGNIVTFTSKELKKISAQDLSNIAAGILADMVFGNGLGYLSKISRGLIKQVPGKVLKVAEKVLEPLQQEQKIATTPEGIQIVLKAEADQATKQGIQQVGKTAGKMEQETAKEAVKQVEKYSDPQSAAQYDMLKKSLKTEEDAARKAQSIQTIFSTVPLKQKILEAPTKELMLQQLQKVKDLPIKITEIVKDSVSKFENFQIFIGENNNFVLIMTKPGRDVGRKAIYYNIISPSGTRLKMFKDSFDAVGKFLHRKFKTE